MIKRKNTGYRSDVGLMQEQLKFVLDEVRQVLSFFQKEKVALESGISYDKVYHSGNINISPAVVGQGSSHNEKRRKGSLAG